MQAHRYLRAYMAGITLPAAFLLIALTVFCIARFVYEVPVPIERLIVFPMALAPNIFGAWNMLYVAIREQHRWNIGLHGALLPFLLAPGGFLLADLLGFANTAPQGLMYFNTVEVPYAYIAVILPIGIAIYYLIWKYVVSFFNSVLEIA